MTILIIDNYDSFTYNIVQQVKSVNDRATEIYFNDAIDFEQIKAKRPTGIIISPGPGHPARPGDFGVCRQIIERREELGCPILGICLGHQGIAHMLGGKIEKASQIVHGKVSRLETVARSSLFKGVPQFFDAMRYHSLVVSQTDFPTDLTVTAIEPASQTIMALEHQHYPLFGLQFHPESIGTECGSQIMRNFSELCH